MRSFRDAEWEDVERLRALGERVQYAEQIGETFSCESADDLPRIARYAFSFGISNRDAAVLRYYAERIELENGSATTLDHAIARALLALHDGGTVEAALDAVCEAIKAWEGGHGPSRCASCGGLGHTVHPWLVCVTCYGAGLGVTPPPPHSDPLTGDDQAYALEVLGREPEGER